MTQSQTTSGKMTWRARCASLVRTVLAREMAALAREMTAQAIVINGFRVECRRLPAIEQKVLASKRCAAETRSWESSDLSGQLGRSQCQLLKVRRVRMYRSFCNMLSTGQVNLSLGPRAVVLVLLLVGCLAPASYGQSWARKMFSTNAHDFGVVARGAKAEFAFVFTNHYQEEVHIAGVRTTCGCTTPRITTKTLKSLEQGAIVASYNTRSFSGARSATITVLIDRPYRAEVQLQVTGFIRGDVVLQPGLIDFGEVDQGASARRAVEILYAGKKDWQITRVRTGNPYLKVAIQETMRRSGKVAYELAVELQPSAPSGYLRDALILETNDREQRGIPLPVEGKVLSPLVVSPGTLFLGDLEPRAMTSAKLVVRGKEPFAIKRIHCPHDGFAFAYSSQKKRLHLVRVTFQAQERSGRVSEEIQIESDLKGGANTAFRAFATIAPVVTGGNRP